MASDHKFTEKIIGLLEKNRQLYNCLFASVDGDSVYWKPAPEKWCQLEIVCHLYDEEREDFRARTRHALETPNQSLKSIDPQGWVSLRRYIEQDYNEMVHKFLEERAVSVEWLRSLSNPTWENTINHPRLGAMSANKFLTNWLAHDFLHFRQINRLKYQYLLHVSKEDLSYAGKW